jgi:hypothetical protein
MPFVSITRLRVRSWLYLPMFAAYAWRSARQCAAAPGNRNTELLADRARTFWTVTLWENEAAMKQFMLAGTHRLAMPKLLNWCDEAAVAHWSQETENLPTWHEAWRRLLHEGRRSKVAHPSAAHLAHELPVPYVRPLAERHFK